MSKSPFQPIKATEIPDGSLLPIARRLLTSAHRDPVRLALSIIKRAPTSRLFDWLTVAERLSERRRDAVNDEIRLGLRVTGLDVGTARRLVFAGSEWVRRQGWTLLAEVAFDGGIVAALWDELLGLEVDAAPLRTATEFPVALELVTKAPIDVAMLAARLSKRPVLVRLLSSGLFEAVVGLVSPDVTLKIIAAATDDQWPLLRDGCLRQLERSGLLLSFWRAAGPALRSDAGGKLRARLVDDPAVARTIVAVADPTFLETADASLRELMLSWVSANAGLFPRGSPYLFALATHAIAAVRDWGLRHLRDVGLDVPLAVRLLECGSPPAADLAREFFETLPAANGREMESVLALCGHPQAAIRAFGQGFLERRWASLPQVPLVRFLAKQQDPSSRELLATALLRAPRLVAEAPGFDERIIRTRVRANPVKVLVMARLELDPGANVPIQLEMARTHSAGDAAWALRQLARLALSGQPVEGFSIDSAAGV